MPRQWTTAVHHNMTSKASKDTGSPGGEQAQSNTARLQGAFPDSPMMGTTISYGESVVNLLRYQLVTNTIGPDVGEGVDLEDPRAQAQGYWGFEDPKWTALDYAPEAPAGLAPDLDGQPEDSENDIAGNTVASNLGPNLRPPPINSPTDDVTTRVLPDLRSTPPFIGNGKANPRKSSLVNKEKLVESQEEGNVPLVKGGNPSSDYAGDIGDDA
jgi:hypothetical protein